jgi:hypothetical protein
MSARFKPSATTIRSRGASAPIQVVDTNVPRAVGDAPTILTRGRRRGFAATVTTPVAKTVKAEALLGHAAIRQREHRQSGKDDDVNVVDPNKVRGEAIAVVVSKRPGMAAYVGRMLAWQSLRPTHVVVCSSVRDYDTKPIEEALPGIPVVFVRADGAASLGELRNSAMQVASSLSDKAIMCTIDDDDCYGVHYLAGIMHAWHRHPIALVVGLGSFETRSVDGPPAGPLTQRYRVRSGLRAPISGATISIPVRVWKERHDLRYAAIGCGEDIEFLKRVQAENRVAAAAFGDFVALRYTDPAHAHTSVNRGIPGVAP